MGRRNEEYSADVSLCAKRTLDKAEFLVFKFHYLGGADWKVCCKMLGITRAAFFRCSYRCEQKCGRAFRELVPFPLFPVDSYFQRVPKGTNVQPFPVPEARHPQGVPLTPPLGKRVPRAPVIVIPIRKPAPVPVPVPVPVVTLDAASIPGYVRALWKAEVSPEAIAARLNRMGVAPAQGNKWLPSMIRRMLLSRAA